MSYLNQYNIYIIYKYLYLALLFIYYYNCNDYQLIILKLNFIWYNIIHWVCLYCVCLKFLILYNIILNFYSNLQKLKLMLLKKDDVSTNSLLSHLRKINSHLEKKNSRFLTGDTMCCFDCELMPRLQHIRVAGKSYSWAM